MNIKIPSLNGKEQFIDDKNSIILIGANGAGKTRMSVWIDKHNSETMDVHRISAQKDLNLPANVNTSEMETAEKFFLYGRSDNNISWLRNQGKFNNRWRSKPETTMLADFDSLMVLLMTENYEKSVEYREKHKKGLMDFDNETRIEKIKRIWENVIKHRKLKICAGKIQVTHIERDKTVETCQNNDNNNDNNNIEYNGNELSDGERAVFHFIGEALCAPQNSLIIVDEPENHLHKSILVRLWNEIEAERNDCVFLYITHNLEFADSRINSQIIWVKDFTAPDNWDYQLIKNVNECEPLKLAIMGNRHNILLVEGTAVRSIDRKLYSKIFDEYNIIPMEGCNSVIQAVKAYKNTDNLHYINVIGIVDRDRRSEQEILNLKKDNIFAPEVAEVENLFLLPEIITIVANKQDLGNNIDSILSETKMKIIDFLKEHLEEQALLFTKQRCQNRVIQNFNAKTSTIVEFRANVANLMSDSEIQSVYNEELARLNKIVGDNDYLSALKVINNKGLLPYTQLTKVFGWKKDYYIDYVLKLINDTDEIGRKLKKAFRKYIAIM